MLPALTLTRAQYDIVWHDLGLGEQPYPLAILQHGRTTAERALVRNRVYGELTAARLADGHTVSRDVEDVLRMLSKAPLSLDMIWLPERDAPAMRTALAVTAGRDGLLAQLTPSGLRIVAMPESAVVGALLDLLPPFPAAPGRSVTVPVDDLRPAEQDAAPSPDDHDGGSIYQAAPQRGVAQQVRSLEKLFAVPRLRGGQLGVNVLDRHGRRARSRPLEWFDTVDGRCMAQTDVGMDGRLHLLVAPADTARIARRVRDMIDELSAVEPNG